MLRQYLYISTAPGLPREEIENILEACKRNNEERGVTGLLLYNGRNFMQLLEGDAADLFWVMRKISSDKRHSGISRLADIAVDERSCPDWTMRHVQIADDVDARRAKLEAELPDNLQRRIRETILNFAILN